MRPVARVRFLYSIITTFSIFTVIWYILSAIKSININPVVQMTVSYFISLFIFIDLFIMIVIWKKSGEFRSTKHIRKWPLTSIIMYVIIIIINLCQGTTSHEWISQRFDIDTAKVIFSVIAIVATIINMFAIFQAKRQIKRRPKR
jgi:glucan phosphoethanolaminetransferase (alkaline phosphatase superfamily)